MFALSRTRLGPPQVAQEANNLVAVFNTVAINLRYGHVPFPDARFDAVVSTLMLHHLPGPVRQQCAREVRRVLKPGGRVLAVDFATPARKRTGLISRFHRHGHLTLRDIVELLSDAGLSVVESGSVGVSDLQFVVATVPSPRDDDRQDRRTHAPRSFVNSRARSGGARPMDDIL